MKIKFLGTGTSTGVPEIGCRCKVCTSKDEKDTRLRSSVLLTVDNKALLIDCGPDFRQQMLREEFKQLNGVLLTHEHYDHVGGIDDLRPFCRCGGIEIYSNDITIKALQERIPYCFDQNPYPGVPVVRLNTINSNKPFDVDGIEVQPIKLAHYKLPILGYRVGNFAYLTDVKSIPESEYAKLEGLDMLVLDALRQKTDHVSHLTLEQALDEVERIAPKRTYLIHMSHQMGLHEEVEKTLPRGVHLSFDGLEIEL